MDIIINIYCIIGSICAFINFFSVFKQLSLFKNILFSLLIGIVFFISLFITYYGLLIGLVDHFFKSEDDIVTPYIILFIPICLFIYSTISMIKYDLKGKYNEEKN